MRLDKFLQTTGLLKRREAAKEACREGKVLVNRLVARGAKEVSPGQIIEIHCGERRLWVQVLQVPTRNVPKAQRANFVRVLEEKDAEQ
jgi:ribosomal 50S subunit-recycling heat shock protein